MFYVTWIIQEKVYVPRQFSVVKKVQILFLNCAQKHARVRIVHKLE